MFEFEDVIDDEDEYERDSYCDPTGGYGYANDDAMLEAEYWAKRNRGGKRHPCPTCHEEDSLTDFEKKQGYQCDYCADVAEGLAFPRG